MHSPFQASAHQIRADTPQPSMFEGVRSYCETRRSESARSPSVRITPTPTPARMLGQTKGAFRRFYEPFPSSEEYEVSHIDGVAYGWNPVRQTMTVLLYCVWKDPEHRGKQPWQFIENCPPELVMEYMRRYSTAGSYIFELISREKQLPYFVGDPEPAEDDDDSVVSNPTKEGHVPGPESPCVPTKLITPREHAVFRTTQRRETEATNLPPVGMNVTQVTGLDRSISSDAPIVVHMTINLTFGDNTVQNVREGKAIVVNSSEIVDLSTNPGTARYARGDKGKVIIQEGNRWYDPALAPGEDD